jgi:hypothetical protein
LLTGRWSLPDLLVCDFCAGDDEPRLTDDRTGSGCASFPAWHVMCFELLQEENGVQVARQMAAPEN